MKNMLIILSFLLLTTLSCEEENIKYDCEAIVLENINSGVIMCDKEIFTLKFIKGIEVVNSLLENNFNIQDSVYNCLNLPEDLQVENLRIKLNVRELESIERPSCQNFEMPVLVDPIVFITQVEKY